MTNFRMEIARNQIYIISTLSTSFSTHHNYKGTCVHVLLLSVIAHSNLKNALSMQVTRMPLIEKLYNSERWLEDKSSGHNHTSLQIHTRSNGHILTLQRLNCTDTLNLIRQLVIRCTLCDIMFLYM